MPTAIYSSSELPEAGPYWSLRPTEPLGPGLGSVIVKEGFDVKIDLMLSHLLNLFDPDSWTDHGDTHVVVGHGTNEAMNLGLSDEYTKVLRLKDLQQLIKFVKGDVPDKVIETKYHVDASALLEKLDRFSFLSLNHLAIRACNIGNNDAYLRALAELLNVKSISAPIRRDFFTAISPMHVTKKTFMEKAHKVYNCFIIGDKDAKGNATGDDLMMLNFEKGDKPTRFITHAVATTEEAVNRFFRENFTFAAPIKFQFGMAIPLYGINFNHQRMPLIPLFPTHPKFTSFIKVIENPKFFNFPKPQFMPDMYIPKDDPKPRRPKPIRQLLRRIFS